jgi:hypothetical protein
MLRFYSWHLHAYSTADGGFSVQGGYMPPPAGAPFFISARCRRAGRTRRAFGKSTLAPARSLACSYREMSNMVRTHLATLLRAIAERIEPQDRLAVYMDVRQSLAQSNQRLPADMRALAADCTLRNYGLANTD